MDLFVVPTTGFDLLDAFVIVRLDRREVLNKEGEPDSRVGCTSDHGGFSLGWGSALYDPGPRSNLRRHCQRRLRAMGIRDKPIAPASPWQNGFAERLIGSIRRECVDHIIVLGEAHLRRILRSYARYYNDIRTASVIGQRRAGFRPVQRTGRII